jgi:hypothetical protein
LKPTLISSGGTHALMYLLYADRLGEESSDKVLSIFVFHVRTVETFLSGIQLHPVRSSLQSLHDRVVAGLSWEDVPDSASKSNPPGTDGEVATFAVISAIVDSVAEPCAEDDVRLTFSSNEITQAPYVDVGFHQQLQHRLGHGSQKIALAGLFLAARATP